VAGVTASALVSPLVLLAYRKNLVDKPNNRKLQKNAVPVLGGVCVFMGVTNALLFSSVFFPEYVGLPKLIIAFLCITVMFVVGFYDDLMDISFRAKFASEIFIITLLWYAGFSVDSLAGLFGVYLMNPALSLLFSIVVGLGLINAINMLDGVDGLASGFSIITSILFTVFFLLHGYSVGACISCMIIGALCPFFVCNVFSKKYKMFIGDSGSMVIGIIAYLAVCRTLHLPFQYVWDDYRASFLLAIFAIPVYDTLRVMFTRIMHRRSPFLPDKTHLHHAFVELQYPHLMITLMELSIALIIFAIWVVLAWICPRLYISTEWNVVINVVLGMTIVQGTYFYVQYLKFHNPGAFARHIAKGHRAGRRIDKPVSFIRHIIDGHSFRQSSE
jgi:UDP-N-acetylmuramyl pentapeptide phosphotransferase/UDP-N-acetylglucosamine-1-phosphate transferase